MLYHFQTPKTKAVIMHCVNNMLILLKTTASHIKIYAPIGLIDIKLYHKKIPRGCLRNGQRKSMKHSKQTTFLFWMCFIFLILTTFLKA